MAGTVLNRVRALFHTPDPPGLGCAVRPHVQSAASLRSACDDLARELGLPAPQAALIRAAALLWHDHLEAAHRVVQGMENPDGNFIHAIMHRREPDPANAKYWFRRVGQHPAFGPLAEAATGLLRQSAENSLEATLLPNGVWDPLAFVDVCRECADLPTGHLRLVTAVELQRIEFDALLAHVCAR